MCLKYINATIGVYKEVAFDSELNPQSFSTAVNVVIPKPKESKVAHTPDFYVVTHWNFLGTNDDSKKNINPLSGDKPKCYEIIIRLTKCDPNIEKQVKMDLDEFVIDLQKLSPDKACYPYVNLTYVTPIVDANWSPGPGPYVIKALIREKTDNSDTKYTIQTMYPLYVSPPVSTGQVVG